MKTILPAIDVTSDARAAGYTGPTVALTAALACLVEAPTEAACRVRFGALVMAASREAGITDDPPEGPKTVTVMGRRIMILQTRSEEGEETVTLASEWEIALSGNEFAVQVAMPDYRPAGWIQ